jgi:hypothetical protein
MKKSTKIIWSVVGAYIAVSLALLGIGAEGLAAIMAYYFTYVILAAIGLQLFFIYVI